MSYTRLYNEYREFYYHAYQNSYPMRISYCEGPFQSHKHPLGPLKRVHLCTRTIFGPQL